MTKGLTQATGQRHHLLGNVLLAHDPLNRDDPAGLFAADCPRQSREARDITKLYSLGNVLHQVRSYVPLGVRRRRQCFTCSTIAPPPCPSS